MADLLADYPIHELPHWQGPNAPRPLRSRGEDVYREFLQEFAARGRENFSYFLEHRYERLAALRMFLGKFDVPAKVDHAGLIAVSAWCPGNCGALVAKLRRPETRQVFFRPATPWMGQWRGINVVFDLGVFFGESVILRNRRLHWEYRPGASDDGSALHSGYAIGGFKDKRDWLDPMASMYDHCLAAEDDIRSGRVGGFIRADTLVGMVRDFSTR